MIAMVMGDGNDIGAGDAPPVRRKGIALKKRIDKDGGTPFLQKDIGMSVPGDAKLFHARLLQKLPFSIAGLPVLSASCVQCPSSLSITPFP